MLHIKNTSTIFKLLPHLIAKNNKKFHTVKNSIKRPFKHTTLYNKFLIQYHFSDNKNSQDNENKLSNQQQQPSPFMDKNAMFKKHEQEAMKADPFEDQSTYDKPSSNAGMYMMLISAGLLALVYGLMEIQSLRADKKDSKTISGLKKVTSTGRASIGGQWTLTDTNGRAFSSRDLQGNYYLIYFGFTHCPDICPNSLMKLAKAIQKIKKMPQAQYFNLKTVFVSVDPDRDDAKKIRKFLDYFDKNIIGVTGKSNDDPDLKECMKKFKIYSSKIQFQDPQKVEKGRKSYTIDHTILTYLMDDNNQYLAHLGANLGQHDLAKTIVNSILKNEEQRMKKLKI